MQGKTYQNFIEKCQYLPRDETDLIRRTGNCRELAGFGPVRHRELGQIILGLVIPGSRFYFKVSLLVVVYASWVVRNVILLFVVRTQRGNILSQTSGHKDSLDRNEYTTKLSNFMI